MKLQVAKVDKGLGTRGLALLWRGRGLLPYRHEISPFDCGWSLLNHGVAEIRRLHLGNLNPIHERKLFKLDSHHHRQAYSPFGTYPKHESWPVCHGRTIWGAWRCLEALRNSGGPLGTIWGAQLRRARKSKNKPAPTPLTNQPPNSQYPKSTSTKLLSCGTRRSKPETAPVAARGLHPRHNQYVLSQASGRHPVKPGSFLSLFFCLRARSRACAGVQVCSSACARARKRMCV